MADEHLIEPLVEAHQVFKGSFLDVRRDTVQLPKQQGLATREYVRHSGAVMIVPILDDGRLVLERQYRHPIGQVLLEFPAGKIDPNESQLHCAQRELLEETGYTAREWACAGVMHNAPAYSTEGIGIWFARGLQAGPQQLDHGEHIEVVLMEEAELDALAGRGEMTDAKSLIALMWLQKWRAGQWPLHWQSA
ncbi:NUDIX hydrolase [Ideonella margarita]|jgi:ADP-ribose pyrophosphatase|uniref:GDP-mannose pyrophosphatase n=1 Tax=Ideonella margarita TaxID=2984191 RepID=A0ABU9C8K2_9BURK